MIDVEALATPAFLVEVRFPGAPVEVRLNAAARSHPALVDRLSAGLEPDGRRPGGNETPLAALLRGCAARRHVDDIALTSAASDGTDAWRASLIPMVGQDERVTALLGICRDDGIRDRVPPQGGDHLSLALRAIHGAEWRYDVKGGAYHGSDEMATLLGESTPRPVTWAEWLERVHPQDLASFLEPPAPEGTAEFRFRAVDGELRWVRCSRVAVTGEDGEVEAVLGIMVDITPERVRETAWAELATHDPLTGLLNRRGLRHEIERLQAESSPASCLALLAIDLDHFKTTNDEHGHAAGAAVLVEAARRLAASVEGMICARLGGDEFVAVLAVSGKAEAHRLRTRLRQEFRRPLAFRGRWLPVAASVGVACVSGGTDIVRLMDEADADLYARKHARVCAPAAAA